MNKLPENLPENYEFLQNQSQARRVIKDIYGSSSIKGKIMLQKLEKCKSIADIDNLLIWGRVNLL